MTGLENCMLCGSRPWGHDLEYRRRGNSQKMGASEAFQDEIAFKSIGGFGCKPVIWVETIATSKDPELSKCKYIVYLLKFVAILAFLAAFFVQSVRIVSMDYVKLILSHKILWRFPTANQSPKGADGDGSYGVVFGRYLGLTTCSDPGHRSDLQIYGDFTPCSCWMLDSRVHTNQMSSHHI